MGYNLSKVEKFKRSKLREKIRERYGDGALFFTFFLIWPGIQSDESEGKTPLGVWTNDRSIYTTKPKRAFKNNGPYYREKSKNKTPSPL